MKESNDQHLALGYPAQIGGHKQLFRRSMKFQSSSSETFYIYHFLPYFALAGEEWVEVESPVDSTTKLVQVNVGHNSVWAVTSDKRVWFRKGVRSDPNSSADLAKGSGWVEMVGNMNMVSVAPNDQVRDIVQRSMFYQTPMQEI